MGWDTIQRYWREIDRLLIGLITMDERIMNGRRMKRSSRNAKVGEESEAGERWWKNLKSELLDRPRKVVGSAWMDEWMGV